MAHTRNYKRFESFLAKVEAKGRWVYPLDPSCPDVKKFHEQNDDDPYSEMCGEDLYEGFEKKHRAKCKRCQEFGAENVDTEY